MAFRYDLSNERVKNPHVMAKYSLLKFIQPKFIQSQCINDNHTLFFPALRHSCTWFRDVCGLTQQKQNFTEIMSVYKDKL